VLPFRRRVVAGQLLQYNAMIVSPFELFRTRIDELEAERKYIQTLKEYWQARADLQRAVGGSFEPRAPAGGPDKQVLSQK
jgi:cobalt-zinc-cadmium efflux system outer membrane protein